MYGMHAWLPVCKDVGMHGCYRYARMSVCMTAGMVFYKLKFSSHTCMVPTAVQPRVPHQMEQGRIQMWITDRRMTYLQVGLLVYM